MILELLLIMNGVATADEDWSRAAVHSAAAFEARPRREVLMAVIDTGVDATHPKLQGRLDPAGKGFTGEGDGIRDGHGHGTHVAGIVASVNPYVRILPIKFYSSRASAHESLKAVQQSLRYAIDRNVDIINFSGGGIDRSSEEFALLKEAAEKNILVVCAAGNEGMSLETLPFYPASYDLPNIVAVTAVDQLNRLLPTSNRSARKQLLAAPGHLIPSAFPGGTIATMTGTSQATAFVSAIAALISARFEERPDPEFLQELLRGSSDLSRVQDARTFPPAFPDTRWALHAAAQGTVGNRVLRNPSALSVIP